VPVRPRRVDPSGLAPANLDGALRNGRDHYCAILGNPDPRSKIRRVFPAGRSKRARRPTQPRCRARGNPHASFRQCGERIPKTREASQWGGGGKSRTNARVRLDSNPAKPLGGQGSGFSGCASVSMDPCDHGVVRVTRVSRVSGCSRGASVPGPIIQAPNAGAARPDVIKSGANSANFEVASTGPHGMSHEDQSGSGSSQCPSMPYRVDPFPMPALLQFAIRG
jgi:hypothetical protein